MAANSRERGTQRTFLQLFKTFESDLKLIGVEERGRIIDDFHAKKRNDRHRDGGAVVEGIALLSNMERGGWKEWFSEREGLDVEKCDGERSETKRLRRYIRGMKREEGGDKREKKSRRSLWQLNEWGCSGQQ